MFVNCGNSRFLQAHGFGVLRGFLRVPGVFVGGLEENFREVGNASDHAQEITEIKHHQRNVNEEIMNGCVLAFAEGTKHNELEIIVEGVQKEIHDDDVLQLRREIEEHIKQIKIPEEIQHEVVGDVFGKRNEIAHFKRLVGQEYIAVFAQTKTDEGFVPTQTLFDEFFKGVGDARLTNRQRLEINFVTEFADFHGDVAVESRTNIPSANAIEHVFPKGSKSTRNHAVNAQMRSHNASHRNGVGVLNGLQGGGQTFFVIAHLHIASNRANAFVEIKRHENILNGVAVVRTIGVQMNDVFSFGKTQGQIGSRGFSSADFIAQKERDQSVLLQVFANLRCGIVRSVVYNDQFKIRIGLFAQ